jgi:hypothetical protein
MADGEASLGQTPGANGVDENRVVPLEWYAGVNESRWERPGTFDVSTAGQPLRSLHTLLPVGSQSGPSTPIVWRERSRGTNRLRLTSGSHPFRFMT